MEQLSETPVTVTIAPQEDAKPVDPDDDESTFDPSTVTQVEFDTAMGEIQDLITRLNYIIRTRNYEEWISYLSPDYFEHISSVEFLSEMNNLPRLKTKKIILTSPNDYFMNVVVPSRTNERVDAIEFITHKRLKVFTVTAKRERLRLYDLQKTDTGWKIIN